MDERASGSMASMRRATRRNSQSGSRRMRGMAPGGTPSMRAGRMAAAFSTASASLICAARSSRQRRSASWVASGRPAERVQRVVEVEQQLAPQHAAHVGDARRRPRPATSSALRKPGTPAPIRIVPLVARWKRAGLPVAVRLHDIEGHHARHHAAHAAQPCQQHIDIADAVLQAHHRDAGGRVLGDQAGHGRRCTALDGDEDDVGLGEGRCRIGRELDRGGCQRPGPRRRGRRCAGRARR